MACEDLSAAVQAIQNQIDAILKSIADTPAPERAAAQKAAQPQLNKLNTQRVAAVAALVKCQAAANPPRLLIAPKAILGTSYNNPAFNTSSPTWAKDVVGGKSFLALSSASDFEWTQVLDTSAEYEVQFVGASGWVISPDTSDADNPFAHPFGLVDWEFFVAPDAPYQALAAPTTNSLYEEAANLARENGIAVPNCLGVETDVGFMPEPWRLQHGDRVCVWGRWIVDTGHPDFHTEIHPPAVLVGGRVVYADSTTADLTSASTFSPIIGRPFLVSQRFSDGHALKDHLLEEVAKLKGLASLSLEAHAVLFPKPFSGVHLMIYTVRPPAGRLSPLDRLMVRVDFTVRTGVTVQVTNAGDSVNVFVGMNDLQYKPAPLPKKNNVQMTISKLKQLNPDAASAYEKVIFVSIITPGNPLAPLIETNGVATDNYDPLVAPAGKPTVIDVTALPENTPVTLNDNQPFPVIGSLTLTWERHDGYVQIQNGWHGDQYINNQNGPVVTSAVQPGWWSADWVLEAQPAIFGDPAGKTVYWIRNRWQSDQRLNIESGTLASSAIQTGWLSARWTFEPIAGPSQFQIRNVWQPALYLHIESGPLVAGPIDQGMWSARWNLLPAV